jgi:hypothetical protein
MSNNKFLLIKESKLDSNNMVSNYDKLYNLNNVTNMSCALKGPLTFCTFSLYGGAEKSSYASDIHIVSMDDYVEKFKPFSNDSKKL